MRALRAAASVLLAAVCLGLPGRAHAGFEDLGAGARPYGMGNAFTALADDVNAMHFNPAGLGLLKRPEMALSHARLFMGLEDGSNISHNYLAYAHPLKRRGTVGIGLLELRLSGYYSERSFLFSYGKKVHEALQVGGGLRMLQKSFNQDSDPHLADDPVFSGGSGATGVGLDFGVLLSSQPYAFGLSVANLNKPDVGLQAADPVPRSLKVGLAYRPRRFDFDADFVLRGGDWDMLFGMERWFMGRQFAGRLGLGLGSRSDRDVSAGLSYRASYYQLDYGVQFPLSGVGSTAGTHRFSLTVRFGKPPKVPSRWRPELTKERKTELELRIDSLSQELEKTRAEEAKSREILKRLDKKMKPPKVIRIPAKRGPKRKKKKVRPKSYVVKPGETLQSIAEKLYGDPGKWVDIYRVNQDQIGAGGKLHRGQRLVIP